MRDMRRTTWTGIVLQAALAASCSSGGTSTSSTTGTGGASTSSTQSTSSTSTTSTSGTGGGTTTTSTTTTSGTGGAPTCTGCVTVTTLPAGSTPYGLFVDATNIYWTNFGTGEVMQAKLDGSSPVTLTTGEMAPIAVQAVGSSVYWVSYAELGVARMAPVGGGAVIDLSPAPAAREIFVGSGFVWWTGEPDDVQRAPDTGLPDGGMALLLTGNTLSNGLTGDASKLYWVNRFDGLVKQGDYDLTNQVQLAKGDVPWDVAVDGASIYWTEQGSAQGGMGKVMKASKMDGSGATLIASEPVGTQGIAIDSARVYWTNKTEGTIKSAPIAGGASTLIANGQSKPVNVVVDGAYVYWTNSGGDTIMKAPK